MNEALKKMVENEMGIRPEPEKKFSKEDQIHGKLDQQNPDHAFIMQRNAEWKSMSKAEMQEARFEAGDRTQPEAQARARKIVKKLNGKDVYVKYLADEHDIFWTFLAGALSQAGYERKNKIGSHSTGFDFFYVFMPPLTCPHCGKELPRNYVIKQ